MSEDPIVIELGSEKVQMGLNIEASIKKLIDNIAHKGEDYNSKSGKEISFDEKYENYPELPTYTTTGVIVHYLLKGIKEDMGITFDATPRALVERVGTKASSNGSFTKEKKNQLLNKLNMNSELYAGMEFDEIMEKMKIANAEKVMLEEDGWFLTPEKTKPPMKKNSEKYMQYIKMKDEVAAKRKEQGEVLGAAAKNKAAAETKS